MFGIIISILALVAIPLIGKKIYTIIKTELHSRAKMKAWNADIDKMTDNYINSHQKIETSNAKLDDFIKAMKKETNPQEKARLYELVRKQYVEVEILWAEHEINHTATYNAIRDKYTND